jgi:hypothetical protein
MGAEEVTGWRKSSYSNPSGNCVEVDMAFRKSSHSYQEANCVEVDVPVFRKSSYSHPLSNCVEVRDGDPVAVRDSKDKRGPKLAFTREAWAVFVAGVKADAGRMPG